MMSQALRTSSVVSSKTTRSTRSPCGDEPADLVVVPLAVGDRRGEDRRVGGHADDGLLLDEVGEVAGLDPLAREVVEPDRHPCVGQSLQTVTHRVLPEFDGLWWSVYPVAVPATAAQPLTTRMLSRAASATASRGDAVLLVDPGEVGGRAVGLDRDDPAVVADDLAPALRDAGLDRDARLDGRRDAPSRGRPPPARRTTRGTASTRRGRGCRPARGARGPRRPPAPPSRCRRGSTSGRPPSVSSRT